MQQLDWFDLLDDPVPEFVCDSCLFDINGCCSFDEPRGRYCTLGDSKVDIDAELDQLPRITAKRIADYIGQRLNIEFREKGPGTGEQVAKTKTHIITIGLGQFAEGVFDGCRFISLTIDRRDNRGGFGMPCITIREVYNTIKNMTGGE